MGAGDRGRHSMRAKSTIATPRALMNTVRVSSPPNISMGRMVEHVAAMTRNSVPDQFSGELLLQRLHGKALGGLRILIIYI